MSYVELGYVSTRASGKSGAGTQRAAVLPPNHPHAGGVPAFFDESTAVPRPSCAYCDCPLLLIAQVYAPTDVERTLYIYACNAAKCSKKNRSWRAFRSQGPPLQTPPEVAVPEVKESTAPAPEPDSWSSATGGGDAGWGEAGSWGADAPEESVAPTPAPAAAPPIEAAAAPLYGSTEAIKTVPEPTSSTSSSALLLLPSLPSFDLLTCYEPEGNDDDDDDEGSGARGSRRTAAAAGSAAKRKPGRAYEDDSSSDEEGAGGDEEEEEEGGDDDDEDDDDDAGGSSRPRKSGKSKAAPKSWAGSAWEGSEGGAAAGAGGAKPDALVSASAAASEESSAAAASADAADSGEAAWAGERYEKTPASTRAMLRFTARVARFPQQCLRYEYGGAPLFPLPMPRIVSCEPSNRGVKSRGSGNVGCEVLYLPPQATTLGRSKGKAAGAAGASKKGGAAGAGKPGPKHLANKGSAGKPASDCLYVPRCEGCGSERRFELQLMPHLLQVLDLDMNPSHCTEALMAASTPSLSSAGVDSSASEGAASASLSSSSSPFSLLSGGLDFLTVAVFSCEQSCPSHNEEFVVAVCDEELELASPPVGGAAAR